MLTDLVAALLSASIGFLFFPTKELVKVLIKTEVGLTFFRQNTIGREMAKLLGLEETIQTPESLFRSLSATSEKMDVIVRQIQEYTRGREQAVFELESQLGALSQQEQELNQRISGLQNVPLPAAEYFAQIISKGEKRGALRDYLLFLLGVLVSAVIGILLRK